jgi:hypothetical protein
VGRAGSIRPFKWLMDKEGTIAIEEQEPMQVKIMEHFLPGVSDVLKNKKNGIDLITPFFI